MRIEDAALVVVCLRHFQKLYGLDQGCAEALDRVDWEISTLAQGDMQSDDDYEIGEPLIPITVDQTGRGDA